MKRKSRPEETRGSTKKVEVGCSKLFITVNVDEEGRPIEVFTSTSSSGGCVANIASISKLISMALQCGLLKETIETLRGIKCTTCFTKRGELPKERRKEFPSSCGDAIARYIEKICTDNKISLEDKPEGELIVEKGDKK